MTRFKWTDKAESAALLVASERHTNQQIAETLGVGKTQVDRWKTYPEFRARVDEHQEDFRATVRRRGIGQLERRVAALNDRWERMQRVIEARAEAYADDDHGGETGLIRRKLMGWSGKGEDKEPIFDYEFDAALLKELREHEKQAAQELGQWTEKRELTGQNGGPIELNMRELSDDELVALRSMSGKVAVDPVAAD